MNGNIGYNSCYNTFSRIVYVFLVEEIPAKIYMYVINVEDLDLE